jgi:hypothetical protein
METDYAGYFDGVVLAGGFQLSETMCNKIDAHTDGLQIMISVIKA